MTMTGDQYEARIRELEEELERLKTGCRLTLHAAPLGGSSAGGGKGTFVGLEEMVLVCKQDRTITYLNGPMAKLIQVEDRRATHDLGQLADRPELPAMGFHFDVLVAAIDAAFSSGKECVVETVFPGLPTELLPGGNQPRASTDPILRFIASPVKEQVQVVGQDVTQVRWLESMFSRYVSRDVLEVMQRTQTEDYMRPELREITILFGDLRGFTAMCEGMPPEAVHETVNSFLKKMVECVESNGGTVDKFVGDEIMALFGAPVRNVDHALQALICSLEMQQAHTEWCADRTEAGKPAPKLGIGMATGKVVIGNVGTDSRLDYTALGATVNLAARLCGKAEGDEILTIRATHEAGKVSAQKRPKDELPFMRFARKGMMEFKNVQEPVEVIRVRSGDERHRA